MKHGLVALLFACALATSATPPAGGAAVVPRCAYAEVVLLTRLDSARVNAGDAFVFKTLGHIAGTGTTPDIPAGTRGYGVIAFADHAHANGQPGRIAMEPRYLVLHDGTHVQVLADPQLAEAFSEGTTRNLGGAFQFVPVLDLAVGGYNALHRGKEVVIARGAQFRVVLGDELASGACSVPPPSAPNVR